jgi:hypothetical protein
LNARINCLLARLLGVRVVSNSRGDSCCYVTYKIVDLNLARMTIPRRK